VRRAENARLTSAGASVSVSADERGEGLTVTGADAGIGGKDTSPQSGRRPSQCGNGMGRLGGHDDGVKVGTGPARVTVDT
jgi:hypothetical protein